jgi:hypothetical protein
VRSSRARRSARRKLQGASLDGAQLQGASLDEAQLWRTDARGSAWEDTRVIEPQIEPMSAESFAELKEMIGKEVPVGDIRRHAMERIEKLDRAKALEGEAEMAKVWEAQARSSPATDVYEKRLARIWQEIGCSAEGAPHVIRGLLARLRGLPFPFDAQSPHPSSLAKAFLDEEHCPGARGLSDAEIAKLKAIRDRTPKPIDDDEPNDEED